MEEHTFVIPAYKQSPYLEQCIQSLLNQTVKSKIVITTSTPATFIQNIALKYNIEYWVNTDSQKGIAADWNFALSKAGTTFVTIAHQDDVYRPLFVEETLKQVNNIANKVLIAFTNYTDLVNGKARNISVNSIVKSSLLLPFAFNRAISNTLVKKMMLLLGDPICCPAVTLNMAELGNFIFPANYQCALDWYAWYQLARQPGAFVFINKKLLQHRIHVDSETTNQIQKGIRQQEELRLFELMWGKGLAGIIAKIYALGYKDNRI